MFADKDVLSEICSHIRYSLRINYSTSIPVEFKAATNTAGSRAAGTITRGELLV